MIDEKQKEYNKRATLKRKRILDELGLPRYTKGKIKDLIAARRNGGTPERQPQPNNEPAQFCCPNCGCNVIQELERRLMALRAAVSIKFQ